VLEKLGLGRDGLASGAVSGFATGLFSIPEGMAYAQLAGVSPVYGLYSGMVATLVASLTTGTVLMISTLTSAIALSTASVLDVADISDSDLPRALFTITLLTGGVMFLLGLLRLGSLVSFVSNAVMTGFVIGASFLIIVGELGDFSGYDPIGGNKLAQIWDWITNIGQWDGATAGVAFATVFLVLVMKRIRYTEKMASVLALAVMTVVVAVLDIPSLALVRSIAEIPNSLPAPMLPDFSLVPKLALGSVSVALVALVQGAGISTAYPNPAGTRASQSRDFLGEGLGNIAGAFFQSMGTGGSLSRTGISVGAGAKSRWAGVFAACWLGVLILLFGSLAELVPLAVIAGLLFVIGFELISARAPAALLAFRSSTGSAAAMAVTFGSALFIPLQWTIFLGAGVSLLVYVAASAKRGRAYRLVRNDNGRWEERDLPSVLSSNEVMIIEFRGISFFAEVPALSAQLPVARDATGSVVMMRIRDLTDIAETGLTMLVNYLDELAIGGNQLILVGVQPDVIASLKGTGVYDRIGEGRVFAATIEIFGAFEEALSLANEMVGR
jgi:sulfate permease, SulP family